MRDHSQDIVVEGVESRNNRDVKVGRFFCYLNGKTYPTLRGLANAIRPMSSKEYYDGEYKTADEGQCQVCGKPTRFNSIEVGYSRFCNGCYSKTDEHKAIISSRFKDNDAKRIQAFAAARRTNESKPDSVKQMISATRLKTLASRYGESYLSDRAKQQWRDKSPDDIAKICAKATATKIRNDTIGHGGFANSNKRVVINGREFFCQGYEDQVIRMLIHDFGFGTEDVLVGKGCPRVKYAGNVSQHYRPDIFIPSLNLYIEVKSEWTYFGKPEFLEVNIAKQKAVLAAGHSHIIFVIHKTITDDDKLDFSKFLSTTISSQALEIEKVQRLSGDTEYRPIAIGSGSARHPKWMMI